jgi:hypothetical protein
MLVAQAKKAYEIFFDTTVSDEICNEIEKSINYLKERGLLVKKIN